MAAFHVFLTMLLETDDEAEDEAEKGDIIPLLASFASVLYVK